MSKPKITTAAALLAASTASLAHAGGLFVGDPGTQAMQRGGAFVAKADDPTALKENPAGLLKAKKFELYLGSNFVKQSLDYTRAGTYRNQPTETSQPSYVGTAYPTMTNEAAIQPVPFLAATERWDRFAFGEGIFAPQGTPNRDFQCSVSDTNCEIAASGAPAPQRYDVVSQKALIVFPAVGVAARITDDLDIGARFSWGFGSLKARTFTWGITNAAEDPLVDGDFSLDVKDNFIPEWGLGILYRPTTFLEFGAAYSSAVTFNGTGTGTAVLGNKVNPLDPQDAIEPLATDDPTCPGVGTITALTVCLQLKVPQSAQFGGRWIFRDGGGKEIGDVEVDLRWENWSAASDIDITVEGRDKDIGLILQPQIIRHGFQDVWSVRTGGHYRLPVGDNQLELRAGGSYDTAAAPISWTRADLDGMARLTLAGGVAFEFDHYRIDAGFAWVHEGTTEVVDVTGSTTQVQPNPIQPTSTSDMQKPDPFNAGTYNGGYIVAMVGVTAMW